MNPEHVTFEDFVCHKYVYSKLQPFNPGRTIPLRADALGTAACALGRNTVCAVSRVAVGSLKHRKDMCAISAWRGTDLVSLSLCVTGQVMGACGKPLTWFLGTRREISFQRKRDLDQPESRQAPLCACCACCACFVVFSFLCCSFSLFCFIVFSLSRCLVFLFILACFIFLVFAFLVFWRSRVL